MKFRKGVAGYQNVYRIIPEYTGSKIKSQFESYLSQKLSEAVRTVNRDVVKLDGKEYVREMIPLNSEYDAHLGNGISHFGKIFGKQGISSAHRFEDHLVNGWKTKFGEYWSFRHGIMANKHHKNKKRALESSKNMVKELLTASVAEQLANIARKKNISLEKLSKLTRMTPLNHNFLSVGLVTPDSLRYMLTGSLSEKSMLQNQIKALYAFDGLQEIEYNGLKFKVDFNIMPFNYGVNAGAVGKLSFAPGLKLGIGFQHTYNKNSLAKLEKLVAQAYEKAELADNQDSIRHLIYAKQLLMDIKILNSKKNSYLKSSIQYESVAKEILLMNELRMFEESVDPGSANGYHTAFGCMSNKDRGSIADITACVFSFMKTRHGFYPSFKKIKEDVQLREEFAVLFAKFAIEAGSLVVGEYCTEVFGLKVGHEAQLLPEAGVWAIFPELFEDIKGLAATAGS